MKKFLVFLLAAALCGGVAYAQTTSYVFNPFTQDLDAIGSLNQTGTFISDALEVREDGTNLGVAGTLDFQDNILVTLTGSLAEIDVPDIWVNETGDTMTGNLNVDASVVIGSQSAPGASVILGLSATDKALSLTQVADPPNDIATPVEGMILYQSSNAVIQAYLDGNWVDLLSQTVGDDIWMNETGDTGTGTHDYSAATLLLPANAVDAITEISSSIKSGLDGTLITGTATSGECAEFDANGDIIGAGAACGTGGGVGVGTDLAGVQFVVLTNTGTLDSERALSCGTGLTCTDNGAGSTIAVSVDDDYVLNTGDVITGGLQFSGVSSDITTPGNEDLTLNPGGTGDVVISGSLDIGVDICNGKAGGGALTTDTNGIIICEDDDSGSTTFSGGGGVIYFIPETFTVYGSLAISGTLGVNEPAAISTNSGSLDYHVLAFASGDTGGDSGALRELNIPADYVGDPVVQIYYMLLDENAGTVEWEAELLCVDDGEELLNVKGSVASPDTQSGTVPATAGLLDVITVALTDPGCSPGDIGFILISTDADDATNDSAAGVRYVKQVVFLYSNE